PGRQAEREEILLPDLAAAVLARHGGEGGRALETDRLVAERAKRLQVAPGAAAEIEDPGGRRAGGMPGGRLGGLAGGGVPGSLPRTAPRARRSARAFPR